MVKQQSKLINSSGGEGCIFIPELPCNKKQKTKRKKRRNKTKGTKRKTKLLFGNIPSSESSITKIILKKSKNHKEWCLLWDKDCQSKEYQKLKQVSEVEKCFVEKKKKIPKETDKFKLLHGDYIGITSTNYYISIFNDSVIEDFYKFRKEFYKLILDMKSLFIGLVELNRIGICHNDIKVDNVIYDDNALFYIDFGLSFNFKNSRSIIPRMKKEFNNGRIYEAYPYEYIYYPKYTEDELDREVYDIENNENRIDNVFSEYIHERLFNRDLSAIRLKMIQDKKSKKNNPNLKYLVEKIDVYSLGVFPLMILVEASGANIFDFNEIIELLKSKDFIPIMNLLYDMTEQDYRERISANEAYDRYLNLIEDLI